jgi:hypothetical protein
MKIDYLKAHRNGVTLKRLILYGGECSTIEHPVASFMAAGSMLHEHSERASL